MGQNLAIIVMLFLIVGSSYVYTIRADDSDEQPTPILATYFDILLTLFTSVLAIILLLISVLAYRQDQRVRLFFVMAAFALFAIKGTIIAIDDLAFKGVTFGLPQQTIIVLNSLREPLTRILDMGVLLFFFLGILKK